MDSGNSGSLQSSSGGEEEFDSRGPGGGVDSSPLSALLMPTPPASAGGAFSLHGSLYGLQELAAAPLPRQHLLQQGMTWSPQFAAGPSSSSSPPVVMGDAGVGGAAVAGAHQAAGGDPSAATARAGTGPAAPPRGSRKRTRASRRAPTTVLTTDTSNFRAMVQEFTGIPSPPFAAGVGCPAASLRTRFDHLFPSPSNLRSGAADPASLSPYLLRPFAQKIPTTPSPFPPYTSSSSSTPTSSHIGVANARASTATATTTAASPNPTAAADAIQLTSSPLLRMQDTSSYLAFHNLLGSSQPSSQHMFGGFTPSAPRLHEPSPSEFLAGIGNGSASAAGGLIPTEGLHMHQRNDVVHHGGDELSGVVAGGASGGGSCKLNYTSLAGASSSSAAAGADKAPDGAGGAPARPTRGEGLDPWICTSE